MDRKLAALRGIDLLARADEGTVAAMAASADARTVAAGEDLFVEGEPSGFVFVVESGVLEVRKSHTGGREIMLRVLGPGEAGGLTSTVVERARSATLRARDHTTVLTIARGRFLELLDQHPDLVRSVLAHLGDKVRGKTVRLTGLLARNDAGPGEPVAVFDAKPYDRRHLARAAGSDLAPQFFAVRLDPQTAPLAAGHRVVCAFVNDDLGAATLENLAAVGVELVALRCAGYNNVDLAAAARLRITVTRVPGYSPHAVAEHTMALILTLDRKIHRAHQRVREGNFSLDGLVGFDLHGRTAGVVGLGRIGRCLATILRGFGMEVLASDPQPDSAFAARAGVQLVDREDLFRRSDVVALNAPLTPETHHLVDAAAIAAMKDGVMLVNTGRGALLHTGALIDGLKSGKVGSAGLDVYEEEGGTFFEDLSDAVLTDDQLARLLTFPNVVVTSHQAFLTVDALDNIAETTAENVRQYLAGRRGRELDNVVLAAEGSEPA